MSIYKLALEGKHNIYNSMASGIASRILELRKDIVRDSLTDFQNVEHRLETVVNVHGIKFVNDSNATNINSTWYALESMEDGVVWIVGGVDKGNDYSILQDVVKEKVKAVICLGKDNSKIKEAFKNYSKEALQTLRLEKGTDFITEEKQQSILSYSGDTPVRDFDRWKDSKILIHEATFLDPSVKTNKGRKKNEHSILEEVLEMVAASKIEQLILGHFSSRYSKEQIEQAVKTLAQKYALNIPIFCVFPGETMRDILAQTPSYPSF